MNAKEQKENNRCQKLKICFLNKGSCTYYVITDGGVSLRMITVLHRGGSGQMIIVLHRGGPANDYGIT